MKKYDNFCSAFKNLKEIYDYNPPYNSVVLTGLVGLFEICFEQSWKAIKEFLESEGFDESQTGSPRQILKTAFQAGIIQDEKMWLSALTSRNNVSHAYNHQIANDIIQKTKDIYFDMFAQLKHELNVRK